MVVNHGFYFYPAPLLLCCCLLAACGENNNAVAVLADVRPNPAPSVEQPAVSVTQESNGDFTILWSSTNANDRTMVFVNTQPTHQLSDSEVIAFNQASPVTWTPTDPSAHYFFTLLSGGQLVIVDGKTGDVVEPEYSQSE